MTVHPWAWWGWALGVATAVSLTTNPFLLAFLALGVTAVVLLRRSDAPWARSLAAYFVLGPRTFSFPDPGFGLLLMAFLGFLVCYLALAWATTGGARALGRTDVARGDRSEHARSRHRESPHFCVGLAVRDALRLCEARGTE